MLTCNTTRIVKEKCRERKREEQNKINNLICSVEKKTMYDNTYNKNLLGNGNFIGTFRCSSLAA